MISLINLEVVMKIPGGFDFSQMMKQAQEMPAELPRAMLQLRVAARVGGGIVSVAMNGANEVLEIKIDPEAVKSGDVEMLQDLILAAVNEAARKADEAMKGKLGSRLGGMGLPGGLI